MTSQDQKIAATGYVLNYEAQAPNVREQLYPGMVAMLTSLAPWTDDGPFWSKVMAVGYWDTWKSLRNRIDLGAPSRAARVVRAAPESVIDAAVEGFKEGLPEGLEDVKALLNKIVIGGTVLLVLFVIVKARS